MVNTLEEAVSDCALVVGTSARSRTLLGLMLNRVNADKKLVCLKLKINSPVALGLWARK